jgi:hypothetical protein
MWIGIDRNINAHLGIPAQKPGKSLRFIGRRRMVGITDHGRS